MAERPAGWPRWVSATDAAAETDRLGAILADPDWGKETGSEVEQLRSRVAALEAECAALAAALDDPAVTHEYLPSRLGYDWCSECGQFPADRRHRTSARVRAEHGHGAT